MTWWQAAVYAKAGIPVRRESVIDPLAWFVFDLPGLCFRYEEENSEIGSPAAADVNHYVVQASQFTSAEFAAVDWTTFGLVPGADVDPPDGPETPGGGLPDPYPPIPPGAEPRDTRPFPEIPGSPQVSAPPRSGAPHWENLTAGVNGPPYLLVAAGTLFGTADGTSWICTATCVLEGGAVVSIALDTVSDEGPHDMSGEVAASPPAFNRDVIFTARCIAGPASLVGQKVIAIITTSAD